MLSAHPEWFAGLDGMGLVVLHISSSAIYLSIYLSICHPHSDDATLSLGLETMMHATFIITPLVKKSHIACVFFCFCSLFFHFWVVPSSGFSKSLFGNPSSSN
jgi:hypothetical protein